MTPPGTGVLLNNGMLWFDPEPGKPNSVCGGVRPLANMAPLVALRGESPVAVLGASGGRRILSALAQLAVNLVAFEMRPQDAVSAPRIDASNEIIIADSRLPSYVLDSLRSLGHDVETSERTVTPPDFARPLVLSIDESAGLIRGGTEPFHPAACCGF